MKWKDASHSYLRCWTLYHNRCMKNEQMQSYLKCTWYIIKNKVLLNIFLMTRLWHYICSNSHIKSYWLYIRIGQSINSQNISDGKVIDN